MYLSFTDKWIELEESMLSEVSKVQKDKCCMFSLMWKIDTNTNIRITTHTEHVSNSGRVGEEGKKKRLIESE
jgi:hypothetical protein